MITMMIVTLWWILGIVLLKHMYRDLSRRYNYVLFPIVFLGGAHLIMISLVIWGTFVELGIQ